MRDSRPAYMKLELKLDILKSVDGFGAKTPKQNKKKNKIKPKKVVIISTPMKG